MTVDLSQSESKTPRINFITDDIILHPVFVQKILERIVIENSTEE